MQLAEPAEVDQTLIKEGDTVIIRLHDDENNTFMLTASGTQKIGKSRISVKNIIGRPYGSLFLMNDRQLEHVDENELQNNSDDFNIIHSEEANSSKGDNSYYMDTNTAQKLKDEDIQNLKQSGCSGKDIIKSLIANSETWSTKTSFAQEKWLKRKQKKYIRTLRVIKSTPKTLCDVYHGKSKDKICNMRSDVLGQVLSYSGVRSGSKVLIFESLVGLIVGSVAYRMRGNGIILAAYAGQQPHFPLVDSLNLDSGCTKIITPVPSTEIGPAASYVASKGFSPWEEEILGDDPVASHRKKIGIVKPHNNPGRHPQEKSRIINYLRQGFDSLIIASKYNPLPILKETIVLLGPSAPFVVYSEFMEPLVECYLYLQSHELALRLRLFDIWKRDFQVLSGRIHPQMFMPTSGGYILVGIKVAPPLKIEKKDDDDDQKAELNFIKRQKRT